MSFDYYENAINETFKKNSIIYLDELLRTKKFITSIEVVKIMVELETNWQNYMKYDVQLSVIIINNDKESQTKETDNIFNYKFDKDIKLIIQDRAEYSYIYYINKSGKIIEKKLCEKFNLEKMIIISDKTNSIVFNLGMKGIDGIVDGKIFQLSNCLDSYRDIININTWKTIDEYKSLLKDFFDHKVQYDPFNRYFIQKSKYPKNIYDLLDKHPKALYPKPEEIFHKDLLDFLKNKCKDTILKEVYNNFNERYDIWVLTEDKKLYVFEIKWLGKSISPEGNIFSKYNTKERAIEGAYQLKDYVDNAEKYSCLNNGYRIYCGVLVTFDARSTMDDISFDEIFNDYPQLDLNQHFKMNKEKIKASQVYKKMKKAKNS